MFHILLTCLSAFFTVHDAYNVMTESQTIHVDVTLIWNYEVPRKLRNCLN